MTAIDADARRTLEGLADVLIPAGEGMPSASQAGAGGALVDEVLKARWDLGDDLAALLAAARGQEPATVVARLQAEDPDAFTVLATVVAGAYFMSDDVRARLGYRGQRAVPIPSSDAPDEELLRSVRERGPIYRPNPV